jgi:hypothetical protein
MAIGRPDRVVIIGRMIGEPGGHPPVDADHMDVAGAGGPVGEEHEASVRRNPRPIRVAAAPLERSQRRERSAGHRNESDRDDLVSACDGHEQRPPVRHPVARRHEPARLRGKERAYVTRQRGRAQFSGVLAYADLRVGDPAAVGRPGGPQVED